MAEKLVAIITDWGSDVAINMQRWFPLDQALIDLDMTPDQRREILLGLEPEDYVAGPHPDDTDETKEVWVFGRRCEAVEVYIKARVVPVPGKQNTYRALLWSFHAAERKINYPFRR